MGSFIVTTVWQEQRRWISFGAHTHVDRTPCAPAIPQGDPLGPFMMTLWTWAGWCTVESVCSPSRSLLTRIYVDDRSFSSARCWDLMERFHAWCAWSFSVGLLENQSKTVVVASTPYRRQTLKRLWPEHAVREAELLGVCTMVATRGLTKKEKARVDSCSRTVTLLASIGLPFERYLSACRLFAVSKVAYGWLARAPPLTLSKRLFSTIHLGSRRLRSASVWLRSALFGGNLHLDVLFATQLVGILSRVLRSRTLTWTTSVGSPAKALSVWLRDHGWTFIDEWKWHHDPSGCSLDFTVLQDAGARQHEVRQAWRAWCLQRHMSSGRRDADLDCFGVHGYFCRIDWKATRAFCASGPAARAISTGASFLPAALQNRIEEVEFLLHLAWLYGVGHF